MSEASSCLLSIHSLLAIDILLTLLVWGDYPTKSPPLTASLEFMDDQCNEECKQAIFRRMLWDAEK